jgi:hypothetical protein
MMANAPPMPMRWTGEALEPVGRFKRDADRSFVIGQVYRMAEIEERSMISHNHEFAWLKDAWLNLPEDIADEYPSPEHLRKRALVQAGFYTEQVVDAGSNAAALRVATRDRSRNEFSLVIVRGPLVIIRDPASQSKRAMGAKEFQRSKTAIMEVIADLIGVSADDLAKHGGQAA